MTIQTAIVESSSTNTIVVSAPGPQGPAGTGTSITIQEEGSDVGALASYMNFVGSTITATDVSDVITITVNAAAPGSNSDITSMSGLTGGIATPDFIDLDTAAGATRATGRLWWNNDDNAKTLTVGGEGTNVNIRVGEQSYYRIKASAAITKGQVVMFTGTVGASGGLQGAPASGLTSATASYVMGIAAENIALNGWGYVTEFGSLRQVNTSAFLQGAILYLDPSVAGGLTATVPAAPAPKVEMASVVHSDANGILFVRPTWHFKLTQLNDVDASAASDTDLLQYNGTSGVWQHSAASSIIVGNVSGTVAVANGGTGSTTAAGALTSLGAYPATNPDGYTTNTGTVTSVAATAGTGISVSGSPITSSGTLTITNTAPDQTVVLTEGGTTTISGTYPNFTISSADQYSGTVTSVAASVPTGFTVSGTPITTSGTLAIAFDTGYALPTTASQTNWDSVYSTWGGKSAPSGTVVGTSDSQTLTNKTLSTGNTLDAGTAISDTGTIAVTSPGFRGVPQNAKTAAYTLALTDAGKHISITTGGITIPANASVAFPVGTTIVIYNDSSSDQTVAITTDTMYQAGTANTGTRTLAQRGLATLVKVGSTTWAISGAGIS